MDRFDVCFDVSRELWMTTVSRESPDARRRKRGRLRAWAGGVWRAARRSGVARPVDRYVLLVSVAGRRESPVLAAETVKPLIDAGTDRGVWPDDDPFHRIMTCYLTDPAPTTGGAARIRLTVVAYGGDPLGLLLDRAGACRAARVHATVGADDWLTSNMVLDGRERERRQGRIVAEGRRAWRGRSVGAHAAVACMVRYPDGRDRYKGDPDNTAETATAVWGAGALDRLCPASPSLFAFLLADGRSRPGTHELDMLVLALDRDPDWRRLLA